MIVVTLILPLAILRWLCTYKGQENLTPHGRDKPMREKSSLEILWVKYDDTFVQM